MSLCLVVRYQDFTYKLPEQPNQPDESLNLSMPVYSRGVVAVNQQRKQYKGIVRYEITDEININNYMSYIERVYGGERYDPKSEHQIVRICLKNWKDFQKLANKNDMHAFSKLVRDVSPAPSSLDYRATLDSTIYNRFE